MGAALRLVKCLRSDEGDFDGPPASFTWVVLACAKSPLCPEEIRCKALRVRHRIPMGLRAQTPRLLARHTFELAGAPWCAAEYAITIPADARSFAVWSGSLRMSVGHARVEAEKLRYFRSIANASVYEDYPAWLLRQNVALSAKPAPAAGPLMSIVTPAYKTPPVFLEKMLQSVLSQSYKNWELVLVNASPDDEAMRSVLSRFADPRIRVVDTPENGGIVGNTNLGLAHCTGDYVCFFDHDDTVEPFALAELVRGIEGSDGKAGLLYCDEDNIDENDRPTLPLFKPAFNLSLLLSNNYAIHWLTVRRDLLERIELSGKDVEGAQDYDLTFKISELAGTEVVHIPHIMYHWRIHSGSSAGDPGSKSYAQEAGVHAIEGHLKRAGTPGTVGRGPAYFTYETSFAAPSPLPRISICCAGAPSAATVAALDEYEARCAGASGGSELALYISPEYDLGFDALMTLVQNACQAGVFSVSPRVIRQDGLLDFAGAILSPAGEMVHLLRYLPQADGGYVGRAQRPYDALLGNPACSLVNWAALGGADSRDLAERVRLDDFVRAYNEGRRNVFMPYATAHLNAPRTLLGEDAPRLGNEQLMAGFNLDEQGDPSHNSNFDPLSPYYKVRGQR